MTTFFRLSTATATAIAVLATAQSVNAEVTPDDVWQNLQTYINAFGGDVTAPYEQRGNDRHIGSITMNWTLPFDAGTLSVSQSGFALIGNADGTVSVGYPDKLVYTFTADFPDEGVFGGTIVMTHNGFVTTASGMANNVTYDFSADRLSFALADVQLEGADEFQMDLTGEVNGLAGTSTVAVASLVSASSDFTVRAQSYNGTLTDTTGITSKFGGTTESLTSHSELRLPKSGTSILNLAAAMNKGMRLAASSTMTGYSTQQTVTSNGELLSEQLNTADTYDARFELSKNRLVIGTAVTGSSANVQMPELLPVPVALAMDKAALHVAMPVSASDDLQDAKFELEASGLTAAEQLWGLIDPAQQLPRDPATVRLKMTSRVKSFWDLFDFMEVAERGQAGELPGELHALTLNDLTIEAAGASLVGQGAATFDNSDLQTYGGFPKPVGSLDMALSGANGLMDKLVAMGLLPEDQVVGARMMMGMIAKPDPAAGDDVLKTHLELNEQGHVLANGMRLR